MDTKIFVCITRNLVFQLLYENFNLGHIFWIVCIQAWYSIWVPLRLAHGRKMFPIDLGVKRTKVKCTEHQSRNTVSRL
jgi:hypothetical protein